MQGGDGAGFIAPPIIMLVTFTVPFMGTLPAAVEIKRVSALASSLTAA